MRLDLRPDAELPPNYLKLFNEIGMEMRGPFNETIGRILEKFPGQLDWMLSPALSRNPFQNKMFHYIVSFMLLKKLVQNGESIQTIVTDSPAHQEMILRFLKANRLGTPVLLIRRNALHVVRIIMPLYRFFLSIIISLHALFLIRVSKDSTKSRILSMNDIVLIDTFINAKFDGDEQYYRGLGEKLSYTEKRRLFFVPTFRVGLFHMRGAIKKVRGAAKDNFLFKERFLRFYDYFFAFGYPFRLRRLLKRLRREMYLGGSDILPLIREELVCLNSVHSTTIGILNYCFAKRLKSSGVNVKTVINWFENQTIDKGWSYGFNQFYPETDSKGYAGYIASPLYLNLYPTGYEKRQGLLPKKICVISRPLEQALKEFCPDLKVDFAPAFRYEHLWSKRKSLPNPSNNTIILAALPLMRKEAKNILQMIRCAVQPYGGDVKCHIKVHPTSREADVRRLLDVWPREFFFVSGSFDVLLSGADILVTAASSTAVEALARGVATIVVANNRGVTYNPIPSSIEQDLWRLCYTSDEVYCAVDSFRSRSPEKIASQIMASDLIRDRYFEPVTGDSVRRFLEI